VPADLAGDIEALWKETNDLEPILRMVMNDDAAIVWNKAMAQPFLDAAKAFLEKARQAERRKERWKTLAERFLQLIGGKYRLPDATAYLQQRDTVVIDADTADTIPDEWWRIERFLLKAEILKAHREGQPIPTACSVEKGDPYMVIRRSRGKGDEQS